MVSYGKTVKDSRGCVHSIDNLVVEYIVRDFSTEHVIDSLAEVFESALTGWDKETHHKLNLPACSAYAWFKSAIWGGGFHVQYGQYRDFDKVTREWSEYPLMRIKFNPNKYFNSPLLGRLSDWVAKECEQGCIVKLDYAVDVPAPLSDIQVHSRKEFGVFKGTRYFGQRNKHGRLKVYDKKSELRDKRAGEIPDDCSRVEWTFCSGKPIVFDDVMWLTHGPAPLPDVSELSPQTRSIAHLLLDIRALGGDVRHSLGYLDARTAKKLEPYTIGSGVQLLDDISCLESLLRLYCDELSVSFKSEGVNAISIGPVFDRVSLDDLESDELPF